MVMFTIWALGDFVVEVADRSSALREAKRIATERRQEVLVYDENEDGAAAASGLVAEVSAAGKVSERLAAVAR
jgi:hypothetical protein